MTAYAPTAFAPVAPKPRLALVALVVLTVHALLLLGLPHWARTVPVTDDPPVFQIRTIALAPPQSAGAPAEPAAAPPPPKPKPRPKPSPSPQPAPVTPVNDPPPPLRSGTATPPLPGLTVPNTRPLSDPPASDTTSSLLQWHTGAGFGGKTPLPPIVPPLPPDQAATVIQQAAQPRSVSPATPDASTPGTSDPIPPIQLPQPTEIIYNATVTENGRQIALLSTINWRYDEQSNYDLRWTLYGPAIGDRGRYVTGLVTARGLAPVSVQALGSDAWNLTFDYAQARLRSEPLPPTASGNIFPRTTASDAMPAASAASQPPPASIPLLPGVQDPLSLLIQLSALLAGNPAQYPVGSRIALPVADGGSPNPRMIEFTLMDDSDFVLPDRQHTSVSHLMHEAAHDRDARIELWLSKRHDYLPVRLLVRQPNGNQIDMTVKTAEMQPVPAQPSQAAPSAPASGAGNTIEESGASSLYKG